MAPDGCVFGCSGFVSEDGQRCYPELPAHMIVKEGRFASCMFNFVLDANGWTCGCDSKSVQHEDGDRCVPLETCARTFQTEDVLVCLASETCPEGTKLSTDGQLCTTSCDLWTEDAQNGELRCVDACPGWWYSSENGLCVEEKWRKSTAIAVPVVVVVILAGVVLGIIIIRKKMKAKAAKKEPEKEVRDHVTNA